MKEVTRTILALAVVLLGVGCIKDDIPYPHYKNDIISIKGEGFTLKEEDIDTHSLVATLSLDETCDIKNVKITSIEVTPETTLSQQLVGTVDLSAPILLTLSRYQKYDWTIKARQEIVRKFNVENQLGETVIDEDNRIAKVSVNKDDTDLSNISVVDLKLAAEGIATYAPTKEELTSFEGNIRFVDVTCHGRTERWTLVVEQLDITVRLNRVDAWAKRVWAYAEVKSGTNRGFKYRKTGDEEWTTVPQDQITFEGGTMRSCIKGLTPTTEYEVVAYFDDTLSESKTVTTENTLSLPNGGFERWSVTNGIIYPYLSTDTPFWDTGNVGTKIAGATLTQGISPGHTGDKCAELKSLKAQIFGIGKFAGGNVFVGKFFGLSGMDGLVNFGQPFAARPTSLHGYVKFRCGTIDCVGKNKPIGFDPKVGDPDQGHIFAALGIWNHTQYGGTAENPVQVNTSKLNTLFSPNTEDVIGYGELILTKSNDDWMEFTIPIDYRRTDICPTHLIIVCTASRFCDYFTGSTGSTMWIDDLEFLYD